ncbi:hypothetical protein BH10ACI1_BH10ACI1_21000 [soil metagenome]
MKLRKMILFILVSIAFFQIGFGQEKPEARKLFEFGKICSEELMAGYDSFYIELNNDPSSTGYIVFYGDEFEGRNLNFIAYLTLNYPQKRFDKSRIVLVRGENQAEMKIQFWLVPNGVNPPKPETEFIEQKFASTFLFDKNWADFNRDYGSLDIYSNNFYDLGCEFSPNVGAFAKILLSNSELTGYLIIYTKFGKGKKYGNRIASFAISDLISNYKVPRNRLKTIYGGNREEPQIELWFVPKGDQPPTPKPDSKPKT